MKQSPSSVEFLSGGGELSALIQHHDWGATPLGPVQDWPQSLKTTVSLMLNSRHPMWVGWGPEASFLYNDAYIGVLSSAKHPWALGRPAAQVWAEIWDVCGPLADRVFRDGEASFQDDVRLLMRRPDYVEEVFYSFSYSPIRDESGGVGGLFCPSAETTAKVVGARRLATLSQLAGNALVKSTVRDACRSALDTIGANPDDLPFALLFLADGEGSLALESLANLPQAGAAVDPSTWRATDVMARGEAVTMDVPPVPGLPIGLADQPVRCVRVMPVGGSAEEAPLGVLVAGVSPARPVDGEYTAFLDLVAGQLATTIRNASAVEETRARAERLAALDRAKTTFFSNVSHELRTPLTLMLAPLQDLIEGSQDEQARQLATLALRNGRRLHKLVNTLLDFSRIEAGRMTAHFAPAPLAELTSDLASTFRSAFNKAGIAFRVDCEPPPAPIYVDREMWEKIVLNLVSNALKYTMAGQVQVGLHGDAHGVTLRVQDSGAGIPREELPRLFERFHRIEGSRGRTHEGTGIGLALVQELVKLHGGRIDVSSEAGRGTTFEVWLPAGRAHLPADQVRDEDGADRRSAAPTYVEEALGWIGEAGADDTELHPLAGAPARIVLADDNADMRAYITRLLRAQGHDVTAVSDGRQAMEHIRARTPDLLLTDVMMPGLDGFGLLQAVRALPAESWVPVIMLSARAGEEARIEGLKAGADDYLVKPFSARELTARVGSVLAISRVRREAVLTERRLRQEVVTILESIREGFVALDEDFRFTYVNAEAERLNGVRREELVGRNHFDVYPATRGTQVEHAYRKAREQRVPIQFENHYAPWDRWFEMNCYPLEPSGIGIYYRDVTDRKKADALAREAERRKDEFIATLAHELRNPLAPVRTGLHVLASRPSPEVVARTHKVMERQVGHMVRLIDDLMDVSRISKGKLELRKETVTLRQVCEAALETSRPLFDAARHELSVTLPAGEVWLSADATRLAQAISNLLNNAAKYTPHGGHVALTARRQGDTVDIEVRDSGAGIPPDLLPQVFDMFVQGSATLARAQGGLGIGLTLVRQLVQLHGGEVSARSDGIGLGSTFTISLPVAAAPAAGDPDGGRDAEAAQRLKILVADDNVDAAQTLALLLESLGHECCSVHDGRAAVAAYRAFDPDVVLLDLGMPEMSGYEVAQALRTEHGARRTRIYALTGWGTAADKERCREAGFDLHMTKPIDLPTLERALRESAEAKSAPQLSVG